MLCLAAHFGTMSYSLLTGWYDFVICKTLARMTAGVVCVHVLISLIIVFFMHDGSRISHYAKRNMRTILQRASGLVILIMIHFHVKAFGFIGAGQHLSGGDRVFILVTELIFFGAIFLHTATSFSRSFITMGLIRSEKTEKTIDRTVIVVTSALMIFITAVLTRFLVNWF